ncbi:dipeptidase [Alphaproteobacteria bacterium LSUCC0684]
MQPVFDGHNDILLRLWLAGDTSGKGFLDGMDTTHIDAPRARQGGLAGGFFAMFVPATNAAGEAILATSPIDQESAMAATMEMARIFRHLTDRHHGVIRRCLDAEDVDEAMKDGAIAAILHLEGAEAIPADLGLLDDLYDLGLRSIGPLWSRPNIFGVGVPFSFPGSPDQGPGLTATGKDLVRACNRRRIMVDLSHLNEAGFWDVAAISDKPLVATHSNSHAICPSPRNLTDRQLAAIAESGGIVGLNFAAGFLRADGRKDPATPLALLIRHLDHLIGLLGEGGVALGSDFDGAVIPEEIGDCTGLPRLVQAMAEAGFGNELIDRICRRNWLDHLRVQIG